jgi:predicted short-subunit dehydrogenase-like oxidoreductase (DUF2520 family)
MTIAPDLALACPFCNHFKGSDLGSIDPVTGLLIPFFHPRIQDWDDHFALEGAKIAPLTPEGRVTTIIFQFNHSDRIAERWPLVEAEMYQSLYERRLRAYASVLQCLCPLLRCRVERVYQGLRIMLDGSCHLDLKETGMVALHTPTGKPSIGLIGAGRVGSTLVRALYAAGYPVTAVASRTSDHAQELAAHTSAQHATLFETLLMADLTLIAVSDDQLADVVRTLAEHGDDLRRRTLVHCSGVQPAAVLAPVREHGAQIGGFHPLAAIARRDQSLAPSTTFAIEAEEPARAMLWQMATDLGGRAFDLRPDARPLYHAAAVLASNYTVVLSALATTLLQHAGMSEDASLDALFPLLRSTLTNLQDVGLPAALTGPLVRGDIGTVTNHLAALDQEAPTIGDTYRALALAALPLVQAQGHLEHATLEHLEELIRMHTLV